MKYENSYLYFCYYGRYNEWMNENNVLIHTSTLSTVNKQKSRACFTKHAVVSWRMCTRKNEKVNTYYILFKCEN